MIFQGSVVTQTVLGGLTMIIQLQISYSVYMPKIIYKKLTESRQSYCNENRVQFFWSIVQCNAKTSLKLLTKSCQSRKDLRSMNR